MSGDAVQPYDESGEMGGKSFYLCQSMWMSRLIQARPGSSAQLQNCPSLQHKLEGASSSIFESSQDLKQLSHVGSTDIMTKTLKIGSQMSQASPTCSPRNRKIISASQTDQTTTFYQRQGKCQTTRLSGNDTDDLGKNERRFLSVLAWSPPVETKSLSGEGRSLSQGALKNHEPQMKSSAFFEKNLDFSRSLLDEFKRTTSSIFPHKFNSERTSGQSLIFRQELDQSSSVVPSKEFSVNDSGVHLHDERTIHKFVGDKERDNFLRLRKKRKSLIMEDNIDKLSNYSSICKGRFSMIVGEESQKIPGCSNVGFFPNSSSPPVIDHLEKRINSHCSDETPIPAHNVDPVRSSTNLASMETLYGTPLEFPQTNLNFETKKKIDSNIAEGGQDLSGSSTRVQKNMFSEFRTLSSDFSSHHKHLKLRVQPQGSFKDIEGNGYAEKVADTAPTMNVRDESSDETDIMYLSAFQERNLCSGEASSASRKEVDPSPTRLVQSSQATTTLNAAEGVRKNAASHISLEPPPCAPVLYLRELSRSQNLSGEAERDPASRWVKRLKLGSKLKEASSGSKTFAKERRDESDPQSSLWISRWCKQSPGYHRSEDSRPQSLNWSIGTMALMGKSMKVLKPSCEIKSRGPCVVWKTKQIL